MNISYRKACPKDADECVKLRGKTRQNALSVAQLKAIGVTHESWKLGIKTDKLLGYVCLVNNTMVGYCFGEKQTGEIMVLALLPNYENYGIGKELLNRVVDDFKHSNHESLFLSCSPDPISRSYGFYRHLGWRATGKRDSHQDDILTFLLC